MAWRQRLGAVRSAGRLRLAQTGPGLRDLGGQRGFVGRLVSGRPHGLQSSRPGSCSLVMGSILPARRGDRRRRSGSTAPGRSTRARRRRGSGPRRARPPGSSRWPARCAPRRARGDGQAPGGGGRQPGRGRGDDGGAQRAAVARAAPRGAAAPAGRGRGARAAGRGRSRARRRAPAARAQVARHRRRTGEGAAQPALLGDLVGAEPGRRRGGGPTPTAGPAGRRPAAYSASSSPWHCTRMASVIRCPRRDGG